MNAEALLDDILRREGGYVDDPNDLGGATKYGVTLQTLAAYRGKPTTKDDVRELTEDEARAIYRAQYVAPFAQYAQDPLFYSLVIDSAVQHGVSRVRGWLTISPTYAALLRKRVEFYGEIITARPANAKFVRGWMRRIGEFIR